MNYLFNIIIIIKITNFLTKSSYPLNILNIENKWNGLIYHAYMYLNNRYKYKKQSVKWKSSY